MDRMTFSQIHALEAQLQEQLARVQRETSDLARRNAELARQNAELRTKPSHPVEESRRIEIVSLREALRAGELQIESLRTGQALFQDEIRRMLAERTRLEQTVLRLQSELEFNREEIEKASEQRRREKHNDSQELQRLQAELDVAKLERDASLSQREFLQSQLATEKELNARAVAGMNAKFEFELREQRAKTREEIHAELQIQLREQRETHAREVAGLEEQLRKVSQDFVRETHDQRLALDEQYAQALERVRGEHAAELEKLNAEHADQLRLAHSELEEKVKALRDGHKDLEDKWQEQVQSLIQSRQALDDELTAVRSEMQIAWAEEGRSKEKREAEIAELRKRLSERLDADIRDRVALRELEETVGDLRGHIAVLQAELEKARQDKQNALTTLGQREIEFQQEQASLEQIRADFHEREMQLRRYRDGLNFDKGEFVKSARQLANEIQGAKTMHPLQDYLTLTEFEISKVEVRLKSTPAISNERPVFEATLKQLVEQRDFLRGLIQTTRQNLEEQGAKILKLIQDERLVPVPPPPPAAGSRSRKWPKF